VLANFALPIKNSFNQTFLTQKGLEIREVVWVYCFVKKKAGNRNRKEYFERGQGTRKKKKNIRQMSDI